MLREEKQSLELTNNNINREIIKLQNAKTQSNKS